MLPGGEEEEEEGLKEVEKEVRDILADTDMNMKAR